ncbi:hypothetical protein [Hyphococcus sp. DH-69]|uniref:hypothetical protein n=1 Tax=Hyphococcus formosus TaxID=3143534 RepID=UPI00398B4991
MLRSSLISASAIALLTTAACAQDTPKVEATKLDSETKIVDASQVETRDEAKLFAESEFAQADLDGDGQIDKSEFLAYASVHAPVNEPALTNEPRADHAAEIAEAPAQEKSAEETFAEISNGDEAISETEMVETRVAQFDEADANDDEKLDEQESQQFASMTKPPAVDTL